MKKEVLEIFERFPCIRNEERLHQYCQRQELYDLVIKYDLRQDLCVDGTGSNFLEEFNFVSAILDLFASKDIDQSKLAHQLLFSYDYLTCYPNFKELDPTCQEGTIDEWRKNYSINLVFTRIYCFYQDTFPQSFVDDEAQREWLEFKISHWWASWLAAQNKDKQIGEFVPNPADSVNAESDS